MKPLNECICNCLMPGLEGPKFIFCCNAVSYHSYPHPSWAPHDRFCAVPQRQRPVSDTTTGNKNTTEIRSASMTRKVQTLCDVTNEEALFRISSILQFYVHVVVSELSSFIMAYQVRNKIKTITSICRKRSLEYCQV